MPSVRCCIILAALGIAGTSSALPSLARYFEEVFFRFGKFFAAFVFAEAVAAAAHAGCLNGEDKVVVILSVEERHKALLAGQKI